MFRARATRLHRILVPFVSGAILWSLIATAAFAADKTFKASFVSNDFDAGASYGVAPRAALQLKITNNPTSQVQLGSANVTQPPGVRVKSAAIGATPVTVSGGVMQLRNLNLAPGAEVTVSVNAEVECGANHASYVWPIAAKQANDFNGTGNDNVQIGSLTNIVTGNCQLVFSKQPKSAENSPDPDGHEIPITNKIYDPSGAPVTVTVRDGAGFDVLWWNGTIDLGFGQDPSNGSALLGGDISGPASAGSVEFTPTISFAASGYSLTATGTPADTASTTVAPLVEESDPFNIVDDAAPCPTANQKCPTVQSKGPTTKAAVVADIAASGGTDGDLVILAINDPILTFVCSGYVATSDYISYNVTGSDGSTASSRPKIATLTLDAAAVTKSPSKYEVCYTSNLPFTDKNGVTINPSGPGPHEGLLPACLNKTIQPAPCVVSKGLDKQKNLVIVVSSRPFDPGIKF